VRVNRLITRYPISWRVAAAGIGAVAVVVGLVSLRPGLAPGQQVDASLSPTASPTQMALADETAPPTPTPTASPTPTPIPTSTPIPPTPAPTPPPTPQPTAAPPPPPPPPTPAPPPPPTPIPWIEPPGGAGHIDVPFGSITTGTSINIRLWNLPAPANCWMGGRYSDGSTFNLGVKTATYVGPSGGSSAAYAVSWAWAVPTGAPVGDGRFEYGCEYLGVVRFNTWFGFTLQAP
jgi:hypothetical protein